MIDSNPIDDFTRAWNDFTTDPSFVHSSYSMTILDSRTGSTLFAHNKDVGLPPASSMKTITAAAALHYLGPDFTYQTSLKYSGQLDKTTGELDGFIYIIGSGDPSLGSSRYDSSVSAETIVNKWINSIKQAGIRKCRGIIADATLWGSKTTIITDGWTWNDIGHWYGTGHSALNWRENEFSIEVVPGTALGENVSIRSIKNKPPRLEIINELLTSNASDADASLYYSLINANEATLRGEISMTPVNGSTIRCSVPDSGLYVADELTRELRRNDVEIEEEATIGSSQGQLLTLLNVHRSVPLSTLLEAFLRISINMYGEVFLRTIAHHRSNLTQSSAPTKLLRDYVRTLFDDEVFLKGVATTDGSGLSRSNRLTTFCLAKILFALQNEEWFESGFYNALPIINGIKMKSGTLLNTIAYAGYLREKELVFSFMINNVYGLTAPETRVKVWRLLDSLK